MLTHMSTHMATQTHAAGLNDLAERLRLERLATAHPSLRTALETLIITVEIAATEIAHGWIEPDIAEIVHDNAQQSLDRIIRMRGTP